MPTFWIFAIIWTAAIANSFWEAYVEGRNPWDKRKLGWKIKLHGGYVFPAYHFFLFFVMWPLLLILPLVIYGWDLKLFGILLSAYLTGTVIEDFGWFVVNPKVSLSEFNPKFATYYPWVKIGKFAIPASYVFSFAVAFLSWLLIWK